MRVAFLFLAGAGATAAAKLLLSDVPTRSGALAKEMSHDLEMNFNKIAPFGRR